MWADCPVGETVRKYLHMRAMEFHGRRLPEGLVRTTNKEIDTAGTEPGNLDVLKSKSLAHREIFDGTWSLVLSKSKPYAPGAGFDNMLFVAKEGSRVRDIGDLDPGALKRVLGMAGRLQDVYRSQAERDNPVVLETIAVNYSHLKTKLQIWYSNVRPVT